MVGWEADVAFEDDVIVVVVAVQGMVIPVDGIMVDVAVVGDVEVVGKVTVDVKDVIGIVVIFRRMI